MDQILAMGKTFQIRANYRHNGHHISGGDQMNSGLQTKFVATLNTFMGVVMHSYLSPLAKISIEYNRYKVC